MPAEQQYNRRVEDLLKIVQRTVDEVNQYLQTGEGGSDHGRALMQQQSVAMNALQQAMQRQQEVLASGKIFPARRATDIEEDQEIEEIRRKAGLSG